MNISGNEHDLEQFADARPWKSGNKRTVIRPAIGRRATMPRPLAASRGGVGILHAAQVGDLALLPQMVFPPVGQAGSAVTRPAQAMPFAFAGQVCAMLATDIACFSSSRRDDETRMYLRQAYYEALSFALNGSGIPLEACHHEDRGDGTLVIFPPDIPACALIGSFPALLRSGIRRYNHVSRERAEMQLRAAMHVGPVYSDRYGVSSADIIYLCRMLDARPLRNVLKGTSVELALAISEYLHNNMVLRNPSLAGRAQYTPFKSRVKCASIKGWLCQEGTP